MKKYVRTLLSILLTGIFMLGSCGVLHEKPLLTALLLTDEAFIAEPLLDEGAFFTLPFPSVPIHTNDIVDTRRLELINRNYPLMREPEEEVPAWPTVPVSTAAITIHSATLTALRDLFDAAREAESGTFFVTSGCRDYETQKNLYESAADKSYVSPPGHSEHQSGLAADIMAVGIAQNDLGSSVQGKWLEENAWKYGLILRYPNGKQDITAFPYEPWHFRYIGKFHAWYSQKNNFCLEEYISFLTENSGYSAYFEGLQYTVWYEQPKDGMINIPENLFHDISGDNRGGYIVTAWE